MHYDILNGDADGILSLLQLRLAEPKDSELITGVKRDIALLNKLVDQVANKADISSVTVLDISMATNQRGLQQLLAGNVPVSYFDHHQSGDIPDHPGLTAHINTDADVCTALLVNQHLGKRSLTQGYPLWAITAAFGDNLSAVAQKMCIELGLSEALTGHLKRLGICINYNGYGRNVDDLHFAPAALFRQLLPFASPESLFADKSSPYYQLQAAYDADMHKAKAAEVVFSDSHCKVVLLPDAPWSHRISGVYGNALTNGAPTLAHGVLTVNADGRSYTVSVRAPLNNRQGAAEVCSGFATGGGRAAAAGINVLPEGELIRFIDALSGYNG
jgi:hypothetical protein